MSLSSNCNSTLKNPDITAVVVNYQTADFTNKAVKSILDSSPKISKEVVVVDNASEDGSCEIIKAKWGDRIVLIENKENYGFAKANNQAMRIGRGRYFLLLNSDAEIAGNAIEKMVDFAESNPSIGILGCKVIFYTGQQQESCGRTYNLSYLFFRAFNLYRLLPDGTLGVTDIETYGKPTNSRQVDVVFGCVMLVRKTASEKVGLFDEQFFMYCEDVDWCNRMRKGGFDVYYLSDATVKHYSGGTNPFRQYKTIIQRDKSVLSFMRKEYGAVTEFISRVFMMLFYVIRLPYWLFVSVIGKRKEYSRKVTKAYIAALGWHFLWPCHHSS